MLGISFNSFSTYFFCYVTFFVSNNFWFGNKIKTDFIFPLKELYFEDIKVYVPNKYKKYLLKAYGEYPPPLLEVEKRFPHEGKVNPYRATSNMKKMYPHLYK